MPNVRSGSLLSTDTLRVVGGQIVGSLQPFKVRHFSENLKMFRPFFISTEKLLFFPNVVIQRQDSAMKPISIDKDPRNLSSKIQEFIFFHPAIFLEPQYLTVSCPLISLILRKSW